MSETSAKKSTIYIDAEDEITAIIEKVRAATGSVVALVPPKRAPALQSVVNLKLLQRAAKSTKKSVVLVTSDPSLLPLAGMVKMHVAKTAASRPEIPPAPTAHQVADHDDIVESGEAPGLDPTQSVGELADKAAAPSTTPDPLETVDLDMPVSTPPEAKSSKTGKKPKKPATGKPNKKLKVPNFNKFRNKLLLAIGGLVVLIILFIVANVVLPRATIVIRTDTNDITVTIDGTASTSADGVDTDKHVVPAIRQEIKKTDSQKVPTTGQRDDGTKASGSMTLTNCIDDGETHTVPAGTGFSSGDKTFITTKSVTLSPALYQGDTCVSATFGLNQTVNVKAADNGDGYNLSARSYSSSISGIQAAGSDMTGGTSKIVKIVSQSDVDTAKQKVLDQVKADAQKELTDAFNKQDAVALADTLNISDPIVTSSPNVKAEASEVSVNVTVTYTQVGVRKDDLNKLIEVAVKAQIDPAKQTMQASGLDKAVIRVTSSAGDATSFELQTVATAGPKLDAEEIKRDVAGQKRGETTARITSRPGIEDVDITYSPFWVYSTPKNPSHIKITFEKANGQQ